MGADHADEAAGQRADLIAADLEAAIIDGVERQRAVGQQLEVVRNAVASNHQTGTPLRLKIVAQ